MIQIEELRYKSLIQKDGIVWKANDIFGASGLITVLPDEKGETLGRRAYQEFQGIELTEEWFTKFGFQSESYNKTSALNGDIYYTLGGVDIVCEYLSGQWKFIYKKSEFDYIEIKYVHQLQNLFFALTGSELTPK